MSQRHERLGLVWIVLFELLLGEALGEKGNCVRPKVPFQLDTFELTPSEEKPYSPVIRIVICICYISYICYGSKSDRVVNVSKDRDMKAIFDLLTPNRRLRSRIITVIRAVAVVYTATRAIRIFRVVVVQRTVFFHHSL